MRKLGIILLETSLVIAAVFCADLFQEQYNLIPRFIINLPPVDYSSKDFWTVLKYFALVHLTMFYLAQLVLGVWKPSSSKRTADELFVLAGAFGISTLLVFVTTKVNFDPDFVLAIALFTAIFFFSFYVIAQMASEHKFVSTLANLGANTFKRFFTVPGIAMILIALTPAILAKAFVSSRDVANVITQTRIFFSSEPEYEFSLISAVGETRFRQPMLVREAPRENYHYVLERGGKLFRIDLDHPTNPTLELDISEKVGYVEMENGALGFAFHPNYGNEGNYKLYLYYTDVNDGRQINRLSVFDLGLTNLQERSESELPLLILNRESSGFHNGGSVEFGPDGFLHLAIGEGVRIPEFASQADTLRKGILRIDVNMRGGTVSKPISRRPKNGQTMNYFIPLDNPFLDNPLILEEYWALGLRNPFRISIDKITNQIWAGDVGSTKWEEVNLIKKGGHYQFPFVEGNERTQEDRPEELIGTEVGPVYTYFHTAFERAVIGGFVYRGEKFSTLDGQYLFADNYASTIYAMDASGNPVDEVTEIAKAGQFAQRGISSVNLMANGDVLVTTLGRSGANTGEVLRLQHGSAKAPTMAADANLEAGLTEDEIRSTFISNCARCHGERGRADGPDTALLGVAIADFSSEEFQAGRNNNHIRDVISKGGAARGLSPLMPPWSTILSDPEIDGLTKYVRSLGNGTTP